MSIVCERGLVNIVTLRRTRSKSVVLNVNVKNMDGNREVGSTWQFNREAQAEKLPWCKTRGGPIIRGSAYQKEAKLSFAGEKVVQTWREQVAVRVTLVA